MLSKLLPAQLKPGAFALMLVMAATRMHHFGDVLSLPDASRAVFFLAGLWFGGLPLFIALIVEAGLLDYIAITQLGVSDYCVSSAYVFLIPCYAALWYGGQFCKRFSDRQLSHLAIQFGILVASTSVAFLISNGSFYWLSGRYPEGNWAEYISRVVKYYPPYLEYTLIYSVGLFGLVQLFKQVSAIVSHKEA